MSTTQRIARVSVEDVQRARGRGDGAAKNIGGGRNKRNSNNFRRQIRSSDNKVDEKLVLRDRRIGGPGPPAKPHHAGNRPRDRGRQSRDRNYVSSPSRSRDRPALFNQDPVWELNDDMTLADEFDRSHHNQQPIAMMQLPISALTAMGQNANQLNVPGGGYCMLVPGDGYQDQRPTQVQFSLPAQFAVPMNSADRIVSQNNISRREQISIQLQSDRDVVMDAGNHGPSARQSSTYYTGEPVGHDAVINVPYCRACSVYIPREKDLEGHLRSEKHFRNYCDFSPDIVINDDTMQKLVIDTPDRGRYEDDGQALYSPSTMDRHRRERMSRSLDQEQDYFVEDSRLIRDDDDGRNYRQVVSEIPAPSTRVVLESSRQDHRGGGDRETIDRVYRRPLLDTPSRSIRDTEDNIVQDNNYNRHYDRSSSSALSHETGGSYRLYESSSRDYRSSPAVLSLPVAPPPPILRPPRDGRASIEFNAPKVMSRDWGKGGNKRGDYGQTFDSNDRKGSVHSNMSHCTICGLKGSFDIRSHMLIAHKMQL